MLYDPKWEQQTKADPFSLASLIAWLEKQPASAEYDYTSCRNCMLCQYFRAMGFEFETIAFNYMNSGGKRTTFPGIFSWDIANSAGDDTFGGALKRARALAAR